MKFIGLLLIFLSAAVVQAQTQTSTATTTANTSRNIMIQPVLGISTVSAVGDGDTSSSPNGSQTVGGLLVDVGNGSFRFQTGALYLKTAFTFSSKKLEYDPVSFKSFYAVTSGSINISYLAVPALAKYNFSMSGRDSFYAKGGVTTAFLMSSTIETNKGPTAVSVTSIDPMATLGLGTTFQVSDHVAVLLDISYLQGLTKLDPKEDSISLANRGLIVNLGAAL